MIKQLPIEIIVKILSFLDIADLKKLALLSHNFLHTINIGIQFLMHSDMNILAYKIYTCKKSEIQELRTTVSNIINLEKDIKKKWNKLLLIRYLSLYYKKAINYKIKILPNPDLLAIVIAHPDRQYYSQPYINIMTKVKYPNLLLEYSYYNNDYNLMCNLNRIITKLDIRISKKEKILFIHGNCRITEGENVILQNTFTGIDVYLYPKVLKRKIKYDTFIDNNTQHKSGYIEINIPKKEEIDTDKALLNLAINILSEIILIENSGKNFSNLFIDTMKNYLGDEKKNETLVNLFFGNLRQKYISVGDYITI